MSFMETRSYERLDLEAIRRDNPLPDVVAGAGVNLIRSGREWKACCPFHQERTPSFTVFDGGKRAHCFGCGWGGDVLDFVQEMHGVGLRDAASMLGADTLPRVKLPSSRPAVDDAVKIEKAKTVWRDAIPATGTLAETYLRSRSITCELPMSLRFAELPYPYQNTGELHPCLIACISSPEGPLQGVQRTFLRADGMGKALGLSNGSKLSLGKVAGGAIRLGPAQSEMIVTEGLEDGLTLGQELDRSVWVACGTSNLGRIGFPSSVQTVAIGGDNDETGRREAEKAARRYVERGLKARTFFPPNAKDFNQELMEATR